MTESGSAKVAIILTQVATAEALAAACALSNVRVDAVTSPIGAYAVCRDTSADAPERLAKAVSTLVKSVPLILFESVGGQITATQWHGGERVGALAPGLALDGAPHEFEDVLLGVTPVGEVDGVVSSGSMSRWKALRSLSGSRRRRAGRA